MNNEEKLLKLLQIAVENGWEDNNDLTDIIKNNNGEIYPANYIFYQNNDDHLYSLNDLVTNFENDKISFIGALCDNKTIKTNTNNLIVDETGTLQVYVPVKNHAQLVQLQWVMQPTSERLEWLLETFKHLLN